MEKTYNWGILGAGSIAAKFASDLKLLPNARLYSVGSRSLKRAETFASEHGFSKAYGSYEEFAADPDIDIVYIASRHIGHYPDSLLCLNQGKAVLCEKPVAMNQGQFERMVKLAQEKDLFFMEALWTRFIPSFLRAKEIVDSGKLGRITLIESDFCFKPPYDPEGRLFNKALGGGALLDVGLYPLFLALEFGGDIKDIQAQADFASTGVDSVCSMLVHHQGGAQSLLYCSIVNSGRVESLIHGTEGILRLNKWWHTPTSLDLMLNDRESEHIDFQEPGFGYQYEAAELMHCLDQGKKQSEIFTWEHSRRLIAHLDEIRKITGISYDREIESV